MQTTFSRCKKLLVSAVCALLLYACGGGGGGGNSPPPPPPPPAKFTLSGSVRPAAGTAVDSDVNDPQAPYRSNDTMPDAQRIPNPVTLGGYVNQPHSGPAGRSKVSGDNLDIYRVSLFAGQALSLFIAEDGINNDLDLALYDINGALLDASAGNSRFETLEVSADGEYFLAVQASKGASNYMLTVGQALPAENSNMRLSSDFIPGEAVVKFREVMTDRLGMQAQALGVTARSQGESSERNRLLHFREQRSLQLDTDDTCELNSSLPGATAEALSAELSAKLETLCMVKRLNQDADVELATPNYRRHALFVPNDPFYVTQWHYPQINLPMAWDITSGTNAIVAVIDTGVVFKHPDLQGQLLPGYDFISDPENALDGDGIDPDPTDVGDRSNPDGSSSFHGTHVTGTVAAATNNNLGVAGVAFAAKVMPLRVVGRFGGSLYDIEQAVRYAAGMSNDSGTLPERRADVINLSLGSYTITTSEQALYEQVRARGVVVVAAAGNDGIARKMYPGAYEGVLAVSASTLDKRRAPYSNYGTWISLAAPGGNTATDLNGDGKPDGILSTVASDASQPIAYDYVIWQGTSMAAPHVAGVMALMKALAPNLSPAQIDQLLRDGALTDDLGAAGHDDQFGYGQINAYQAVLAAANAAGNPIDPVPVLATSPQALNFGVGLESQTLIVRNGGAGTLQVNPPQENSGGWLKITPSAVDASGLGTYNVAVQRAGLGDGMYHATITFSSNANSVEIAVIMQVANNLAMGGIGQQYVLLIDPATHKTVAEATGIAQDDGSYRYTLNEVPAGNYQLFSGADSNNNLAICDVGESCGAYLTINDPVALEVNADRSDLDFTSAYQVNMADFKRATDAMPDDDTTGRRLSVER